MSSSGVDLATGKSITGPHAYKTNSVIITSYGGEEFDISELVTDYTITETINSLGISVDITIVDAINLSEKINLSGNERIQLSFTKQNLGYAEPETRTIDLIVLEYPVYSRPKPDVAVYVARCVTPAAYLALLKTPSRAYIGTSMGIAEEMFADISLGETEKYTDDIDSEGFVKYIPTKETYASTINLMVDKASKASGSPFFCYETLGVKFRDRQNIEGTHQVFTSYETILEEGPEPYRTYNFSYFTSGEGSIDQSEESFEDKRRKILSIETAQATSVYSGFVNGAFASSAYEIDGSTKTLRRIEFGIHEDTDLPSLEGKPFLDSRWNILGENSSTLKDAKKFFYIRNPLTFEGSSNTVGGTSRGTIQETPPSDPNISPAFRETLSKAGNLGEDIFDAIKSFTSRIFGKEETEEVDNLVNPNTLGESKTVTPINPNTVGPQ